MGDEQNEGSVFSAKFANFRNFPCETARMDDQERNSKKQASPDYEIYEQELNVCLMPIVKSVFSKDWRLRFIWGLYCSLMIVFLSAGIGFVISKFLSRVTVVRMDQRIINQNEQPKVHTVTLCFHQFTERYLAELLRASPNKTIHFDSFNPIRTSKMSVNGSESISWSSKRDGKSPLYNFTGQYFAVTIRTIPIFQDPRRLIVYEQVPNQDGEICTTFDIHFLAQEKYKFVSCLIIQVENPNSNSTGTIILHDQGTYPFDDYSRNMYTDFKASDSTWVFYSSKEYNMLDTPRSPCQKDDEIFFNWTYRYNRAICQANNICKKQLEQSNCDCSWDILRRVFQPTERQKAMEISWKRKCRPQSFTTDCKKACNWTKYETHLIKNRNSGSRSENSTIAFVTQEKTVVKIEEELFSMAKLLSEIGGLSSFFFGFSVIMVFEILELILFQIQKLLRGREKNANIVDPRKKALSSGFTGVLSLRGHREGIESLRCAQQSQEDVTDSPLMCIKRPLSHTQTLVFDTEYYFEGKWTQSTVEITGL
ncbi:hypothetical protein Ciccas_010351 [Cichlidogyrus casuarinus]|uniref:Uncharacterized protein n=1 Tax=Cichlidogyrus casuarinus TaxID=1844966 RepID=A0ABD2PUP7_9PLAT